MPITHKGMAMLLKHHALDPESSTDNDVKTCVDAAIKNSDAAGSEESEIGEGEGDGETEGEQIENRASEEVIAENETLKAEVAKLKKGAQPPVHVANRAKAPNIDIDADVMAGHEETKEAKLIENRATELKAKGTPGATAWIIANREVKAEIAAGMHK